MLRKDDHRLALGSGPRVRGAHGEFPEDFGGGSAVQQPDDVAAVLGDQFAKERVVFAEITVAHGGAAGLEVGAQGARSHVLPGVIFTCAGSDLAHVVQTRNYVRDAADLPLFNQLYREYFSALFPARTTITNCLPPSLRYEIEAVAVRLSQDA